MAIILIYQVDVCKPVNPFCCSFLPDTRNIPQHVAAHEGVPVLEGKSCN